MYKGSIGYDRNHTKKTTRLSIRATAESKLLLEKAAKRENKNLSDFVLENAISAAEAIVADDSNFNLNNAQWKKFSAALDAPPRDVASIRRLLTTPGIFDEE